MLLRPSYDSSYFKFHHFLYSLFRQVWSSIHDETNFERARNVPVPSTWVDMVV